MRVYGILWWYYVGFFRVYEDYGGIWGSMEDYEEYMGLNWVLFWYFRGFWGLWGLWGNLGLY